MKKLVRRLAIAGCIVFASIPLNAAAAAVIDFGTGLAGLGGTLVETAGDVVGTDIAIGVMTAVGTAADGAYTVTDGLLDFDTAEGTITIEGSISDLSISNQILLSGSFNSFTYDDSDPNTAFFYAAGPDTKSDDLLNALSVPLGTAFEYFGFTIEVDILGTVISTDIVNTEVPIPAAAFLFGSGLLGLAGIARRKKPA